MMGARLDFRWACREWMEEMPSISPREIIWQVMVVLHRYLGVAVGLLMVMWFVSGIVMMYVGLPTRHRGRAGADTGADRMAGLLSLPAAIGAGLTRRCLERKSRMSPASR